MQRASIFVLLAVLCLGLTRIVHAQPRVGETMPSFELQATDDRFYGSKNAGGKVSVYFFVGFS
jgi:hypothetical protein